MMYPDHVFSPQESDSVMTRLHMMRLQMSRKTLRRVQSKPTHAAEEAAHLPKPRATVAKFHQIPPHPSVADGFAKFCDAPKHTRRSNRDSKSPFDAQWTKAAIKLAQEARSLARHQRLRQRNVFPFDV
jgi:hypothetical protein